MEPLTKYLSSTGWKSRDVTKSVCLHRGNAITQADHQEICTSDMHPLLAENCIDVSGM